MSPSDLGSPADVNEQLLDAWQKVARLERENSVLRGALEGILTEIESMKKPSRASVYFRTLARRALAGGK